jgi:hypothetical protein
VPVTDRDRQRLEALIAIVKPSRSIAARLDMLTDDDRNYFDEWKARCERWMRRYPDGEAYEKHLDGYSPQLRDDISVALFGEMPRILKTHNDSDAAQIYTRYCHDER